MKFCGQRPRAPTVSRRSCLPPALHVAHIIPPRSCSQSCPDDLTRVGIGSGRECGNHCALLRSSFCDQRAHAVVRAMVFLPVPGPPFLSSVGPLAFILVSGYLPVQVIVSFAEAKQLKSSLYRSRSFTSVKDSPAAATPRREAAQTYTIVIFSL